MKKVWEQSGSPRLNCAMCLEVNRLADTSRDYTERVMLVLGALQRATLAIRLIEENEISLAEFRNLLPLIWDDLNRATHHLRTLKNPSKPSLTFLAN
jgi:hypothetical protein